jgi:pimeloyl-ACP methyl ester carboxylesterase
MTSSDMHIHLFAGTLPISYRDEGAGRPYLVLHGGAGPLSVWMLASALKENHRVITPTHPGFAGQPRPDWFHRPADLVLAYLALLEQLDLRDVVIIGNSFGGWLAVEMALRRSERIAGVVLLNAVGVDTGSPDKSIVDPMKLSPAEVAAKAFHDPGRYALTPTTPEAAAMMQANQKTLRIYAGEPFMHDPTLYERLAGMPVPSQFIWGASDQIVDVAYGRRFAEKMPQSSFVIVQNAGHFPHIEQLEHVAALIDHSWS